MLSKDEIINQDMDEFLWRLVPFGSLDIRHMLEKAYDLNINPSELVDILYEQAEEFGCSLFNEDNITDLNALFNDYILQQARNDIEELTDVDIVNDYDVYFFANYLDDPLQYKTECKEELENIINEKQRTSNNFNIFSQYVLGEMGITLKEEEQE